MPAIIVEKFDSREATVGIDSPSVDLQFMVLGTELDAEVRALVESTIPAVYANLVFQNYHIAHQGGGVWEVSARYGKLEPKETGQSSYSFDTGGGNQKITQSLETVGSYGADPNDVPDLGLGGSGWKLPDMGFGSGASSTGTGFTPPSAPDATSFGGFGSVGGVGGDSWLPVIVLAVVMAVALVLWWLWPRIVGLRDEPRPLPGLGPWPIDPRSIADREGLVKAFEYLSVLVCGAGAKVWNHVTIATALERAVPQADALADPLARLYAVARYTPANEDLPPGAIAEARQYLCELAGVRAA